MQAKMQVKMQAKMQQGGSHVPVHATVAHDDVAGTQPTAKL